VLQQGLAKRLAKRLHGVVSDRINVNWPERTMDVDTPRSDAGGAFADLPPQPANMPLANNMRQPAIATMRLMNLKFRRVQRERFDARSRGRGERLSCRVLAEPRRALLVRVGRARGCEHAHIAHTTTQHPLTPSCSHHPEGKPKSKSVVSTAFCPKTGSAPLNAHTAHSGGALRASEPGPSGRAITVSLRTGPLG
jgi:hypothetical protein